MWEEKCSSEPSFVLWLSACAAMLHIRRALPEVITQGTVVGLASEYRQVETLLSIARAKHCSQVCSRESQQDLLVACVHIFSSIFLFIK